MRACKVAPLLVQLLPTYCGCCGCLFFLPLLFGPSSYESSVAVSVACWSVAGGGLLDTSVAKLATGFCWTVGTIVGYVFGVGVNSGSWGR